MGVFFAGSFVGGYETALGAGAARCSGVFGLVWVVAAGRATGVLADGGTVTTSLFISQEILYTPAATNTATIPTANPSHSYLLSLSDCLRALRIPFSIIGFSFFSG